MDSIRLKLVLVLLLGYITTISAGTVQQIYIKDSKVPVKGGDIQFICEVSQFTSADVVKVYKTDSMPPDITTSPSLTRCTPSLCLGNVPRHTFSTSSSGVTITVTNLNRSEDQKYWTCAINNQRKYMQLTVYTITPSLQYDNPPSQNQDLVQTSVAFSCSTGCAYPAPNFIWYFNKTGGSRQEWSTTVPVTEKTDDCTDSEKIYTSTLTLSRYTQFTDNTDTSVKFQCGAISITGAENQRFTPASVDVRFAVLVTTPTITDLTTEKLEGDQIRYQCTSSQTRPVAIVTWKLGTQVLNNTQHTEHSHGNDLKSVTSIVTFTASRADNNKTIYCETTIPGQNIVKAQEKMTVYWPPSQPRISNDSFPFLEGQTGKSIYCSSSDYGNHTATATWTTQYGTPDVGDTRKLTLPILTYQVDRSPVKCQLRNLFTQKKGFQIQSIQVLLQVKYSPRIQILVDGKQVNTITKDEGKFLSATCYATGNPNPVVNWAVGQQSRGPTLSFDDIDRTDHGKYTCRATATSTHYPSHNFIKEEELNVIVNCKPSIPKYFNFTGLKDGIPTFRLVGNFNGGLLQTFVIETTEVGKDNWVERLKFNETDTAFLLAEKLTFTFNISGLQPNIYDVRVLTGNDIGWINEADSLAIQFTITGKEAECDLSCDSTTNIQAIVVGIILGFINLLLLTYAGYVTLLLKRKGGTKQENASCRTVTNVPVYTNIVYSTNESDEQQQTDIDDSGDCQYTSLKNRLQDDKQTYDVLGVMS